VFRHHKRLCLGPYSVHSSAEKIVIIVDESGKLLPYSHDVVKLYHSDDEAAVDTQNTKVLRHSLAVSWMVSYSHSSESTS
jgi:transcriptional regulator with PAS, ATPase and Fis domain